jgi:hypothetical protein
MGIINTYTLKQYKECYSDLLERHKLEYGDHNEFTFINSELESFYEGFFDIEQIKISDELRQKLYSKTVFSESLIIELNSGRNEFMDAVKKSNLSSSLIIDFLEQRKQEIEKESRTVSAPKTKTSRNLSIDQRALIMVYDGNTVVTREEHGDDLYNKVTKWAKSKTRTADPDTTKLVLENKIVKFESILPFLMEENKQKAIDEIKTLKLHLLKY